MYKYCFLLLITAFIARPASAIVQGFVATSDAAPFTISIHQETWAGSAHICAGVLLNAKTVITAASCIDGSPTLTIRAGSLDRETGGVTSKVDKIIVSPNYNEYTYDSNYAILQLSTAITNISIATIASNTVTAGESVSIFGWGTTSPGGSLLPLTLHQLNTTIISHPECEDQWIPVTPITSNMACTQIASGGSTCNGDGGGPVVRKSDGELVGIISFGFTGCSSIPDANVHTDVTENDVRSFIFANMI